jgi:hypothetical protein
MQSILTFFAALLLSVVSLSAQVTLELTGGLDHSFRTLTDHGETFESGIVFNYREDSEIPRTQHRFGINVLVKLTPTLQLKSGIRYAETGYTENTFEEGLIWGSQHNGNGGVLPNNGPTVTLLFKDYVYVEVPLQLRWSPIASSNISPFVELGVNPHFFVHGENNLVNADGDVSKTIFGSNDLQVFRSIYFVAVAGIGTSIRINDTFSTTVQLAGRYHLNELGKEDTPINENHYSVGGELGIGYRFGMKSQALKPY